MRWFAVSATYPSDPAIQKIGVKGEVLFMRGLAYSALADTDGFIPDTQVRCFNLPGVADLVAKLVAAELWETVDGGYQVKNWWAWQSPAYSAERKKIKDRNYQSSKRAHEEMSYDNRSGSRTIVDPLQDNTNNPPTPAERGGVCDGQHDNCRRCGTTRRALAKAAATWKPSWCGVCDELTRQVGYDTDLPTRCPSCHPLSAADGGNVA